MTDRAALAARFRDLFGRAPRLFRAPGRINIIGEHTDTSDGWVMPAAIDRHVFVAAAANGRPDMRVASMQFEGVRSQPTDRLAKAGDWADYAFGVAWALEESGIAVPGADLLIEGDVPVGAGISSSAALEVAVTHALLALAGDLLDATRITMVAHEAESAFVGMPCGIMDQSASARAEPGHALMLDCRTGALTPLPLPDEAMFLLIDSAVEHRHADGAYRQRREEVERAAAKLGVPVLRDATEALLAERGHLLSPEEARRCRHVLSENRRVHEAAAALERGDLVALGQLINQSHASLSRDMEVSHPQVDRLAALAQADPGVLGARMMGGGFGGCVLALTSRDAADAVEQRIVGAWRQAIGRDVFSFQARITGAPGEVPV